MMKRLLLVALILLSGTAHAEVKKPRPLAEMLENRLDQTDELTALKMLPSLRDVRRSWVESYEGWKDRQRETYEVSYETTDLDTTPTYAGDIYDQLAMCESSMTNDTGDPYWGYFQFLPSTYASVTGRSCVACDSYAVQKQAAIALIARSGWGQFPGCAAQLGML
jgi:hypothetical protein